MERSPDSGYRPLCDEPIGQIELIFTGTVFAAGTKEPILQFDHALIAPRSDEWIDDSHGTVPLPVREIF